MKLNPLFSPTDTPELLSGGACCLLPGRSTLPPVRVTRAEARVLRLVMAGLSNKEIAAEYGRAESTIKHQVASLLRRFKQSSRVRLVALLYQHPNIAVIADRLE